MSSSLFCVISYLVPLVVVFVAINIQYVLLSLHDKDHLKVINPIRLFLSFFRGIVVGYNSVVGPVDWSLFSIKGFSYDNSDSKKLPHPIIRHCLLFLNMVFGIINVYYLILVYFPLQLLNLAISPVKAVSRAFVKALLFPSRLVYSSARFVFQLIF